MSKEGAKFLTVSFFFALFWLGSGMIAGAALKHTEVQALERLVTKPGSVEIKGEFFPAICVLPETMYADREGGQATILMLNCEGKVERWNVPHPDFKGANEWQVKLKTL